MTVQFNPSINGPHGAGSVRYGERMQEGSQPKGDFAQAIQKSLSSVNQDQQDANTSIVDLLSGKEQDVNTVVASMAKADMSFKMLVGVRNKLVEAYKETMRTQL
jgi:flagellar hook-basal body complex protein FliE